MNKINDDGYRKSSERSYQSTERGGRLVQQVYFCSLFPALEIYRGDKSTVVEKVVCTTVSEEPLVEFLGVGIVVAVFGIEVELVYENWIVAEDVATVVGKRTEVPGIGFEVVDIATVAEFADVGTVIEVAEFADVGTVFEVAEFLDALDIESVAVGFVQALAVEFLVTYIVLDPDFELGAEVDSLFVLAVEVEPNTVEAEVQVIARGTLAV